VVVSWKPKLEKNVSLTGGAAEAVAAVASTAATASVSRTAEFLWMCI
jgi:hypothetical protein